MKCEVERILNNLGYEYNENDVEILVETFEEVHNMSGGVLSIDVMLKTMMEIKGGNHVSNCCTDL
jgi:hypothetical protein